MLQADAYRGHGRLYEGERKPAPIIEAACWAHARRKFFELADIEAPARQKARNKVAVISTPGWDSTKLATGGPDRDDAPSRAARL